jgi:hypothetical protein
MERSRSYSTVTAGAIWFALRVEEWDFSPTLRARVFGLTPWNGKLFAIMAGSEELRVYVRSWKFKIFNWIIIGLLAVWYFFPRYGMLPLYAGVALSFIAVFPILLRGKVKDRNLNSRTVLLLLAYILAALIIGGFLVAHR